VQFRPPSLRPTAVTATHTDTATAPIDRGPCRRRRDSHRPWWRDFTHRQKVHRDASADKQQQHRQQSSRRNNNFSNNSRSSPKWPSVAKLLSPPSLLRARTSPSSRVRPLAQKNQPYRQCRSCPGMRRERQRRLRRLRLHRGAVLAQPERSPLPTIGEVSAQPCPPRPRSRRPRPPRLRFAPTVRRVAAP
jgi:hypothetical protein